MDAMRTLAMIALGLMVMLAAAGAAPQQCIKDQHGCVRNSECCGGCCNDGKCVPYADKCSPGQNPCTLHDCPSGQECYLHQVQCVAAPCEPVPACRSPDYADYGS